MPDGAVIYERSDNGAFRQGEFLSKVTQLKRIAPEPASTSITVDLVNHPFAIIISQDCDLDLDFKARNGLRGPDENIIGPEKQIPNILLCEIVTAEHLFGSGRTTHEINSSIWARIKTNNDIRYHFFQSAPGELDGLGEGVPELAADFKRYFTIMTDDLYDQLRESENQNLPHLQRRLRLRTPYLEHFCTRFGFYLSRVALPQQHFSIAGQN